MKTLRTWIGGAILLVLAACGGGGGSGGEGESSGDTGPQLLLLGGALGGSGNSDGTGGESRFFNPSGVASDGTNLFVADTNNYTIRQIVISSGVVTTLAGMAGSPGTADGTGTAARFRSPYGVATDGTSVFVADSFGHTIRQIAISSGVVSTLAGMADSSGSTDGAGTTARFNYPKGVATDGASVFVADLSNHTIRQIVISSGMATTLAGTAGSPGTADGTGSAARFNYPKGVATDGTNVIVGDSNNHTIRQIVISSGMVTTLAGTAGSPGTADGTGLAARFNNPDGVATDGVNVFVADFNNHTIRKITIATGEVTTLAGMTGTAGNENGIGASARFNLPRGIAMDGTNVYVADASNNTIRRIAISSGMVMTWAGAAGASGAQDGNGALARFFTPTSVATDGASVFVADFNNHTIRKVTVATGEVTTLAGVAGTAGSEDGIGTAARFNSPRGIAMDGTNVFVADKNNGTIRQIVISSAVVTTLAGTAGSFGSADGIGAAASFNVPYGVATDGTSVFVADRYNNTIRQVVISSRAVTTLAGTAGSSGSTDGIGAAARFSSPLGVATDGINVLIADFNNHAIRRVSIFTGEVTTLAGAPVSSGSEDGTGSNARFYAPSGVATDGTNVFVVDTGNYTVRKIVLSTGKVTTLIGVAGRSGIRLGPLPGGLNATYGIAVGSGQLFLAVAGENSILQAPIP